MINTHLNRGVTSVCICLSAPFVSLNCLAVIAANAESIKKEPWQLAQETEVWEPIPNVIQAPVNAIPSDAIILFDGNNLNQWQAVEGGDAKWKLANNSVTVVPKSGDIKTKDSFCDVQLHIEWMTPTKITGDNSKPLEGQDRNNSGIFLQDRYEIQVLDSYNNRTYSNGQAGSVYKQSIPLVNAARAPGEWQSYEIIFNAPKFDIAQQLISPGYVTVLHNGVLVQNHVEIQGPTAWIGKRAYESHGCAPIRLQDHGNPVSFRNIWVRKL